MSRLRIPFVVTLALAPLAAGCVDNDAEDERSAGQSSAFYMNTGECRPGPSDLVPVAEHHIAAANGYCARFVRGRFESAPCDANAQDQTFDIYEMSSGYHICQRNSLRYDEINADFPKGRKVRVFSCNMLLSRLDPDARAAEWARYHAAWDQYRAAWDQYVKERQEKWPAPVEPPQLSLPEISDIYKLYFEPGRLAEACSENGAPFALQANGGGFDKGENLSQGFIIYDRFESSDIALTWTPSGAIVGRKKNGDLDQQWRAW